MIFYNRIYILLLASITLMNNAFAQRADIILTNGKIFTGDTSQLYVQALAIQGNEILAIGTNADVLKLAGKDTRTINLNGKTVIPGINDAHDHIAHGAPVGRFITFPEPILPGPGLQQVLDSLAVVVKQIPKGALIQGFLGLRLIEDPSARRAALDIVTPDHPVILTAAWGHGTILNTKALQMLGISETAKDPVGGEYERMAGSNIITGYLKEYAEFDIVRKWNATVPDSIIVPIFQRYGDQALRFGITTVQNMATSLDLDRMVSVLKTAQLPIRIRVIRFPGSSPDGRDLQAMTKEFSSTSRLRVSGTKWIVDATFLERGALMQLPYSDLPQSRGKLNWPPDTVGKMINEGLNSKEQLLLHIVGDSTPKFVLEKMYMMADANTWRKKRVRFEHGYGLTPDQWDRAKDLGIVVVVNPTHFSFAEVLNTRIGPERTSHYEPLRSLIEAGIPVAIGSDIPNNPYLNILFATIHPSNPREAITREQAVIAYTSGSAYAEFTEKVKGKLIKGMLADLAVLSQDIFTIPVDQLPITESVLTIIDGKIVYENLTGVNNKLIITGSLKETEALKAGFAINVMPNPSAKGFTLNVTNHADAPVVLKVVDVSGRVVERKKVTPGQSIKIGENYRAGIYFAEIVQGNERKVLKLVKIQ